MNVKYLCLLGLVPAVLLFCCSCAALNGGNTDEAAGRGGAAALETGNQAGKELLEAFVKDDGKSFLKQLPEEVAREFGINGFRKTREGMVKQLGTPVSYAFVTNLKHPAFTVSIWKILFVRKSSDNKKEIRQEAMFRAVSGKIDGKERFLGFNFF